MHLNLSGFIYTTGGSFTNKKYGIQKFEETWNSWYINRNELDKICVQHDIAYGYCADSEVLW